MRDNLTGGERNVMARVCPLVYLRQFIYSHKGIINAADPLADGLLTLDNPSLKPILQPSSGIHISLPNRYSLKTRDLLERF